MSPRSPTPTGEASRPVAPVPSPDVRPAFRRIRRTEEREIELGLILGSGLGGLAEEAAGARTFHGDELEGYPSSTARGHAGELVVGELAGRPVGIVRGRIHYYEGHPYERLGYPVRLLRALGARHLLVTKAAGGIRADCTPGTFVLLSGHCAATFPGRAPGPGGVGRGRNETSSVGSGPSGARAVPIVGRGPAYDPRWRARARDRFRAADLPVAEGTYGWTTGPSYETPAEIRMLRRIGADVVGMSTVPEVVQARILGMRVLGVSTVTNRAAGLGSGPLSHREVVDVGARRAGELAGVIPDLLSDRDE